MTEKIDRSRLFIPAVAGLYDTVAPFSYALMRFATGAILFPHGVQKLLHASIDGYATNIGGKGLPFAAVLAYLTFFSEFAGAACLALGLFTRIAAAMVFIQMSVIVIFFLWPNGYFWTARGIEFPLLWAALCLAIFFRGGGRWSIDHYIGKEF
jgi:putative oxidoreductase